ncbi:MAG: osmoprotectant transport system substrate-binding protein [Clostridia bacterium]|nr:osmoprotectant transport system substrate-binding protein [Clostridia bacterium]
MQLKCKLLNLTFVTFILGGLLLTGCGPGLTEEKGAALNGGKLVIASQNYAEPQILSEMIKQLLEAKLHIAVDHKRNFQGSTAVHQAMEAGDVQMYVSYTGTQFTGILGMKVTEEWKDRRKVYEYVRDRFHEKYKVKVFEPFGFNNTYALAVRRETAEKLNLKKASDLAPHSKNMAIATDPTFQERKGDGWDDLAKTYGYNFKKVVGMAYDLMYQALKSGDVDAAVAYSTDGRIPAYDLVILEDDRKFFPPYDAVLFMKEEVLQQNPEVEKIIAPLIGSFTEETIAKLNSRVDVEKKEPAEVAREYLKEKGLL